uniref:Uncharacterized protein n=1 Tax=viral metagenome TaxID=1070528 RepID=A0A6M3IMR8_9ZZZZ
MICLSLTDVLDYTVLALGLLCMAGIVAGIIYVLRGGEPVDIAKGGDSDG